MIVINAKITLQPIEVSHARLLYELMKEVYPLAYDYFWEDFGEWYVNSQYSKENIEKELAQENAVYYFVLFKKEIIGNFRIIWNETLPNATTHLKSVKIHRIYLHEKVQGKGIGKALLRWLEQEAITKNYNMVWLDAMDEKKQAFQFYKRLGFTYHSHCFLDFDLLHDKYRKMSQLYKML